MTVKDPKVARQAYAKGYEAYNLGRPLYDNPYQQPQSIDGRYDYWRLGWKDASEHKPSQENVIDYEWLIN